MWLRWLMLACMVFFGAAIHSHAALGYSHSFCWIVDQQLIHITPWHIMEGKRALRQSKGLAERYPSREIFPFAYID